MKKALIRQAMMITKSMIEDLGNKKSLVYDNYLDDQVIIFGPFSDEFCHGRASVAEILKNIQETIDTDGILNEEMYPIAVDAHSCAILVHFIAKRLSSDHRADYAEQSVTFIWKVNKGHQLHIVHIHYSIPAPLKHPETDYERMTGPFPANETDDDLLLSIRDDQRHLRMISSSNIECAQADGHYAIIYMTNEVVHVRMSWKELLKELKKDQRFLQVHRSHVVRMDTVKMIGRNYVELKSGRRVPISEKNMSTVVSKLTGRNGSHAS